MILENLIITILLVIQVIALICFFVMCINVSAIKKNSVPAQPWQASFNLYYSTGQIEKAKELVMKAIMSESAFASAFYFNVADKTDTQKYLEGKYKEYLQLVGLSFDFNKANDFIDRQSNPTKTIIN